MEEEIKTLNAKLKFSNNFTYADIEFQPRYFYSECMMTRKTAKMFSYIEK